METIVKVQEKLSNGCVHIMTGTSKRKGECCGKKIVMYDRCKIHSKHEIPQPPPSIIPVPSKKIKTKCPLKLLFSFQQPAKPYVLFLDWWSKTKEFTIDETTYTVHRSTNLILKPNTNICIGILHDSKPYFISSFSDVIKKWCTHSGLVLES